VYGAKHGLRHRSFDRCRERASLATLPAIDFDLQGGMAVMTSRLTRRISAALGALLLGAAFVGTSPALAYGTCSSDKVELSIASYPNLAVYDKNLDGLVCAWSTGAHGNAKWGDNRLK
jgi:hypothetical protein